MKIVDDKGKLFGIINVIDLVIILFVVLIGIFAYVKFFSPGGDPVDNETYEIKYTVLISEVYPHIAKSTYKDDPIYEHPTNAYLGKVDEVITTPYTEYVETADGRIVKAENDDKEDMYVVIKVDATINQYGGYVFGNRNWKIGNSISIMSPLGAYGGHIYMIDDGRKLYGEDD